ncbi:MAG: type III-B CRISPR module RAMP protein Cmr6 [Rhizobiaceae bacterium]|nr:type III-B CRISPR module RAMP protein Cmr6 [Rhizobiaceae bacterium]
MSEQDMIAPHLPLPENAGYRKPGEKRNAPQDPAANRGLVFNKFVDRWAFREDKYDLHDKKKDWLDCFSGAKAKAGDAAALKSSCDRLSAMAEQSVRTKFGHERPDAVERPRDFVATSRFATGLGLAHPVENGFLWHHTLGVPYIPGSSIKGMIRAWARQWREEDAACIVRLFGNETDHDAQMGALIVFDALPLEPVELVTEILTPHDGGWRLKGPVSERDQPLLTPGDWHDPVPVSYLAVEQGASFRFALGATRNAQDGTDENPSDVARGYQLLGEALEWIGLGAKTAIGMGRFRTPDAMASEAAEAKRTAREEAARQAEEEERRVEAERIAVEMAKDRWIPAIGQKILYSAGDVSEERVISVIFENGDFEATWPDGTEPVVTDKDESSLIAGPGGEDGEL